MSRHLSLASGPTTATSPITCEWCLNTPAVQVFISDHPQTGRGTALVCAVCGDFGESVSGDALVYRFQLASLAEGSHL